MIGTNQHVTPREDGWAVVGEGNERAYRIVPTQAEAQKIAQKVAENSGGGDVITHGRNNLIRERNTYGKKDPFPPRG